MKDDLFKEEPVLDYVQDLVFIPYDEKGKPILNHLVVVIKIHSF